MKGMSEQIRGVRVSRIWDGQTGETIYEPAGTGETICEPAGTVEITWDENGKFRLRFTED